MQTGVTMSTGAASQLEDSVEGRQLNGPQAASATGQWLHTNQRDNALATASSQQWIFPEGDELFRGIYTRAGIGFGNDVVAVCSALAGEGKTSVSVGLAVTIAQDFPERRVLLVEADVQHPVLAEDFGIEAAPGLLDCLVDHQPLQM